MAIPSVNLMLVLYGLVQLANVGSSVGDGEGVSGGGVVTVSFGSKKQSLPAAMIRDTWHSTVPLSRQRHSLQAFELEIVTCLATSTNEAVKARAARPPSLSFFKSQAAPLVLLARSK